MVACSDNVNVHITQRQELISELITLTKDKFFGIMKSIYQQAKDKSKYPEFILRDFQTELEMVSTWTTNDVVDNTYRFKNVHDNLTSILSNIHIINQSLFPGELNVLNTDDLDIVQGFIKVACLQIARELWKKPYILYEILERNQYTKNIVFIDKIITNSIKTTIRRQSNISAVSMNLEMKSQILSTTNKSSSHDKTIDSNGVTLESAQVCQPCSDDRPLAIQEVPQNEKVVVESQPQLHNINIQTPSVSPIDPDETQCLPTLLSPISSHTNSQATSNVSSSDISHATSPSVSGSSTPSSTSDSTTRLEQAIQDLIDKHNRVRQKHDKHGKENRHRKQLSRARSEHDNIGSKQGKENEKKNEKEKEKERNKKDRKKNKKLLSKYKKYYESWFAKNKR